MQGLLDVMAPGVVLLADGGGVVQAARVPVVGAAKVTRFLERFPRRRPCIQPAGQRSPGADPAAGRRLDTVIGVRIEDGLIVEFHAVRNPEKLSHMAGDRPS